jgi:O-antigen/teichoic acid export membrane protein
MMSLVSFLLNTAFTLYFVVVAREGALGSLKGTAVSAGLLAPYLLWELSRLWRMSFSRPAISKALRFGLPLLVSMLAAWLIGYADRYVLGRFRPTAEVGLYSLAYSVGMGMSIVATAVNQAWTPAFYDLAETKEGSSKLRRLTTIYGAGITLLACAFVLFSRELTQVLAAPAYRAAAGLTPIVVLGYYLQAMYFVTVTPIFFMRKTNLLIAITGPAAAVNLAANYMLVPKWGMHAAAWVTVVTFAVLAGGSWVVSSRVRPRSFEHRQLVSLVVLFALVFLAELTITAVSLPLVLTVFAKLVVVVLAGAAMFVLNIVSRGEAARAISVISTRVGRGSEIQVDPGEAA